MVGRKDAASVAPAISNGEDGLALELPVVWLATEGPLVQEELVLVDPVSVEAIHPRLPIVSLSLPDSSPLPAEELLGLICVASSMPGNGFRVSAFPPKVEPSVRKAVLPVPASLVPRVP
jgi:hypothetical protein